MSDAHTVVIRTGVANLASVLAGLRRVGADPVVSTEPALVQAASHVVLPGVGAFEPGIAALRQSGLAEAIAARVDQGRPLLAVCLGMQLLARDSEESPGLAGLGLVDTSVTRFGGDVLVPQLGWNKVTPDEGCRLLEPGYAYFANSYHLAGPPRGWSTATTDHGGPFVSAIERGPVLACQFHPELSGAWGLALLRRWLATEDR